MATRYKMSGKNGMRKKNDHNEPYKSFFRPFFIPNSGYYGEANIRFMTSNTMVLTAYRIFSGGVFVMVGALASLEFVWNLGDLCMAFLTACNLVAIVTLGKYVFRLLDDYRNQKRKGIKEPVFHRSLLPEIEKELECWD